MVKCNFQHCCSLARIIFQIQSILTASALKKHTMLECFSIIFTLAACNNEVTPACSHFSFQLLIPIRPHVSSICLMNAARKCEDRFLTLPCLQFAVNSLEHTRMEKCLCTVQIRGHRRKYNRGDNSAQAYTVPVKWS